MCQYPAAEVKDYHDQLLAIQAQLPDAQVPHEGVSAEELYAERIALIQLGPGVQPGERVLNSLLVRCILWVEVIEEKCAKSIGRL